MIAVVVIAIDQLTKTWAESDRLLYPGIHILGPIRLARTYNEGVAFGLGAGIAPFLIPLAILGILATLFFGRQIEASRTTCIGVGLLVGGALGNLCDRLFRDHGGAVVDFVEIGWWPVFNVADVCVTVGAVVLVVFGLTRSPPEEESS